MNDNLKLQAVFFSEARFVSNILCVKTASALLRGCVINFLNILRLKTKTDSQKNLKKKLWKS
jgi:hypothetical protein